MPLVDLNVDLGELAGEPDELYSLATEAQESRKEARFFLFRDSPETQLSKSLRMLELLLDVIRRLRIQKSLRYFPGQSKSKTTDRQDLSICRT